MDSLLYRFSAFLLISIFIFACGPVDTPDSIQQGHRQLISLSAGVDAGTGYQVKVRVGESAGASGYDVQLNGKAQVGFDDVRFTDSDGQTVLGYWLDSVTGTSPNQTATFWVKVNDDLDLASQLYIYYGNATLLSNSSGEDTFEFYDGFETLFSGITNGALFNAQTPQTTPTYDGSGEAIHPDVIHMPGGWNGYEYWMAMTPYPGGNDQLENPSVLASNDGETWEVPAGLSNPFIGAPECDHHNDTDIIYNSQTDELWVYYLKTQRGSRCGGHEGQGYYDHNYLMLFKSGDGVNWTGPTTSITWDLAVDPLYLSPSVVQVGNQFYMWLTNGSNTVLYYESSDGVNWGTPQPINIADNVWHLNVTYVPSKGEYWMLSMYPSIQATLRWAVSTDRINWTTFDNPVITPASGGWDDNPYRGTVTYEPTTDTMSLWYSGFETDPIVWHTGYLETDYSNFLYTLINNPSQFGGWSEYQSGGTFVSTNEHKRGYLGAKLVQSSAGSKQILSRDAVLGTDVILEWDMYDDLDQTAFKVVRLNSGDLGSQVGLGVWTGSSTGNYVTHTKGYIYSDTGVARTNGWSKFGVQINADSVAQYFVNDTLVGSEAAQISSAASVSIEGYNGGTTEFYVDDVRVRKAASTPPIIVSVGAAESGNYTIYP